VRIRRTAGTGWQGAAYYVTTGANAHGESGSYVKVISDPTVLNEWVVAEYDMSDLTAGGNDWITSTNITALRFDFGNTASDDFDVDWVALGTIGAAPLQEGGDIINGSAGGWTIDSDAIYSGTKVTSNSGYSSAGITMRSAGSLHSKEFYIDTDGNAVFKGDLSAANGTFAGSLTAKSISAGNIVAGTITATELSANSISAGNIISNTITASEIAAGTITASRIATNSISAGNLAAESITAKQLKVSDLSNIITNPSFSTLDETNATANTDGWTGSISSVASATESSVSSGVTTTFIGYQFARDVYFDRAIDVTEGEEFTYTLDLNTSQTTHDFNIGFRIFDKDDTNLGWFTSTASNTSTNAGWAEVVINRTMPANAHRAIPFFQISSFDTFGKVYYTNVRLRRRVGETLIEDGAITTDKIFANAITAAKIAASTITGTEISAETTIVAGIGNNVAVLDGADSTYRIYAGNATAASAPFRVTQSGTLTATGATIEGALTASSGHIGGFTIDSSELRSGNDTTRVHIGTDTIFLGANTSASAPFSVSNAGALVATNATIEGAITATSGSFTGSVTTDTLSASGGTIGGFTITRSSLFTGTQSNSGYTAAGGLTLRDNGSIATPNFYVTNAGDAFFNGTLEAANGTFAGSLTAQSISAGNIVSNTIKTDNLFVTATDYVNPVSQTEHIGGWAGATTNATSAPDGYVVYDSTENAIRINNWRTSSPSTFVNNFGMRSDTWLADPNKIYRVNCQIKASGTGLYYFGPVLQSTNILGDEFNGGNAQGNISISAFNTSRTASLSATANVYFANGSKSGISNYTDFTVYLVGAERSLDDIPDHTNGSLPYAKASRTNDVYWGLRFLNWASGTSASSEVYVKNVSVQEVGTGQIIADNIKANTITANEIAASTITGTEISAASKITAGTGNNVGVLDGADGTYRIYAGNATPASAPFRVTQSGVVTATNATITGNITANSGTIGGFSINSTELTAGSDTTRMHIGPDKIFMGGVTSASAPFSVTNAGALVASNATITGAITANSGTIGGFSINSTELTAGSDTTRVHIGPDKIFMGGVTSASAPFSVTNEGALIATNATITGAITATSGSFTGSVTTDTLSASGGTIGGFTITRSSLFSGASQTNTGYSSDGINLRQNGYISTPTFYVTGSGDAFFKGTLEAPGGTIGAFSITSSSLFTGTQNQGGGYSAGGITIRSNGVFSSENFYIGSGGNAFFKGTLEAASGTFGGSLTAQSISAGNIVSGTITASRIATNSISAGNIASNTITATEIASGTITASRIATNSISAGNIAANAITASEISADAVTASELQISQSSGQNSMFFDGGNNQILIKDNNSTVRVKIGNLSV
jgi:hypothetical protein